MCCGDSLELAGRVALVTGSSRGIGKAIALKLASQGAKIVINDVAKEAAEETAQEIKNKGGDAIAIVADVSNNDAVKAMVDETIKRWEKIDILVNNAGIIRDSLLIKMTEEAWDAVIDTNLKGTFLCTKYALRSMMAQRWGRVISLSSIAGRIGNVGQVNYSASKAGIIAFTKTVAREVGPLNITANAIAPGFINTEMTARLPDKVKETVLTLIAAKRYGNPEEVAELVGFLASERAGYISGQVIGIDGGMIS